MKIVIVGTGYVGLVTGTCFAETGVNVICVDTNEKKINQLNEGLIPIYEPGLEILIKRNMEKSRLVFSSDLKKSIQGAEAIFIAVGTPMGSDGDADLSDVFSVSKKIGAEINDYILIITKSTVPVGTSVKIRKIIEDELNSRGVSVTFDMASNPEFLKEGAAVEDFLRPERVIVGIENERAGELIKRLYKPFLINRDRILFMDIPSAELTKYAANAMLATRISFINEIANLCDLLGADISQVRKGIGSDSRIGNKFLYAGTGYGGSCFPKDIKALIKTASDHGYNLNVLKAVEKANGFQKNILFNKLNKHFINNLKNLTIGIWGLSFKPQTDDIRESSSILLINQLLSAGAKIRAYDPAAIKETKLQLEDKIYYAYDPYDAIKEVDALVLMTEWSEFRNPDLERMGSVMKSKVIFDGRNIFDSTEFKEAGFIYYGIGKR